MKKLTADQIKSALTRATGWEKNGKVIIRTFVFKNFPAAIKFVNAAAKVAEAEWHHPDIDIRWNKVTLTLTTHDAGGLTRKDFALAQKFSLLGCQ
jgi:4a-hydroxytetrahydrobiopterin dehydratase